MARLETKVDALQEMIDKVVQVPRSADSGIPGEPVPFPMMFVCIDQPNSG